MRYTDFKKLATNTSQVRLGSTSMNFNPPMGTKKEVDDKPSATAQFIESTPEMERERRYSASRSSDSSAAPAIADAGNAWQGYMRDYEQRNNGQLPAFVKKNDKGQYYVERPTEQQSVPQQASAGKVPGQAGSKATPNIQLSTTGQPVTVSTPSTTRAIPQPSYTPNQADARQLAAQEDFDYDANRQQQQVAAQQRAQGNHNIPAYTPLELNKFRPTEKGTTYRVAENRFQNVDDSAAAIAGFKQELNQGIRRGRGDLVMGATYGGASEETVAPAAIAKNLGVVDSALYALERADDNVIDYLVQNPDAVADMTAYLSDEDKAKVQSIIAWRAAGGSLNAQQPGSLASTQPANQSTSGSTTTPILPDLNGSIGPQAKDIFTKGNVKSYREFLAMDDAQRAEFADTEAGAKLLNDFEQFFMDPMLDDSMKADRLVAAIKAGDQSVALLGNDILKLMDSASDDTELSGMAAEVKKMFDGLDEAQQNEIKAAFQSKMWDAVAENPISNLPVAASMFLRSIGLGGIADFTENPWIFYLGSLALLFGVGSLFMGDEQQQPNIVINNGGSQVDPRMAQVPY